MPIKINDLTLPKEKLEKEYQVVNVTRWQKDGKNSRLELRMYPT